MQTLFGETDDSKVQSLKITATGKKILSKNQQMFNKLTKQIETLEKDIVQESEKLSKLIVLHGKEIFPLENKVAQMRIKLAMTLSKATQLFKFSKKQTENIGEAILTLCNDAFMQITPDTEQEAFYDQWADVPYKEELEEQDNQSKEMFSDFFKDMFGFDVNMDDPENFEKFQENLKEKFEQSQQNNQRQHKKSKKQLQKELAQKADEETKNKNIRSIYIALAKVLHPDTEMDAKLKVEKEEIMKKVTVAYDQKDLPTLLKLEMEWVYKTSEHLEKLTDDKLKIYILALKQQATELEREKYQLYQNPRFAAIYPLIHLSEIQAIKQIQKQKKEFKTMMDGFNSLISSLDRPGVKKQVTDFVDEFCKGNEPDDFDDFDLYNDLPF